MYNSSSEYMDIAKTVLDMSNASLVNAKSFGNEFKLTLLLQWHDFEEGSNA